jgi:hypothetical protein
LRRALTIAATFAVALLGTVHPAHAAQPVVQFTTPTEGQRFDVSAFALDVVVSMPNDGTLRGDVTVSWFSPENRPVPAATTHPTGNNKRSMQVFVGDRVFPWNGTYRVDVTAVGRDSVVDQTHETGRGSRQFAIDARPAPPANVATGVDDERGVTVSWSPNGEPDVVGYEVQRQLASDPWQQVTVTDAATTSVRDNAPSQQGGTYRYRIVAFRSSAEVGKLNPSHPSSTSTAQVAPPPTTTTTTTTLPDDDDGGGDGEGEEDDDEEDGEEQDRGTGTGSGSSSGDGTGGKGSTAGKRSRGSGRSSTTLATKGKVDLSGFSSLLERARRNGQASPTGDGRRAEEDDGGFNEKLPFGSRSEKGDSGDGEDVAILEEGISDDGSGRLQALAFLAGGLLATVLVMHLLWVRSEVERAEALETVPPDRPRRRRALPADH